MLKLKRSRRIDAAAALPPRVSDRQPTAQDRAAQVAALTAPDRGLLLWADAHPLHVMCVRGGSADDVGTSLLIAELKQHIVQCLEGPADKTQALIACTHEGLGSAFTSRFNVLLAQIQRPDAESAWTARTLAAALTAAGFPVSPQFVLSLSTGQRSKPGRAVEAALAGILGVPASYFQGLPLPQVQDPDDGTNPTAGEELYNAQGTANPRPPAVFQTAD